VYGRDYPTPDGTCIRDYIHVSDLASAHVLGLERLLITAGQFTYNLGTGSGFSVQQVIDAARQVTGRDLRVADAPRRAGDPAELIADPAQAQQDLGWRPQRSDLPTVLADAWRWHQRRWLSSAP
jgi:UDP-glucose 4-epimerase